MNRAAQYFFLISSVALLLLPSLTNGLIRQDENSRIPGRSTIFKGPILFKSHWKGSGRWAGPEWWATQVYDWKIQNGMAVAPAADDRTLSFLPAQVLSSGTWFSLQIRMSLTRIEPKKMYSRFRGGFRIGRKGKLEDFRNAVVYAKKWIDAVIRDDGRLVLGSKISIDRLPFSAEIELDLSARRMGKVTELTLQATHKGKSLVLKDFFPTDRIIGGISVLSDGPLKKPKEQARAFFSFRDFRVSGNMVQQQPGYVFGPILWSQYTLNKNTVRLQVQLAPIDFPAHLSLWILNKSENWVKVSDATSNLASRTALFVVHHWFYNTNVQYEARMLWQGKTYTWSGVIRKNPTEKNKLKVACFSCDNGYLFPLPTTVKQVQKQNPDMLYFAGDQIYESYGTSYALLNGPIELQLLDYLQKHYLFGWTWRNLLRDRPSIIIPDDHDVFQGNLFGNGGTRLPFRTPLSWASGGYLMPGKWVSAVERINAGHLPKPAVDMTLPIGIKPYFTSLNYGGVGFAILEDRKFKTGPKTLPLKQRRRGENAELLGGKQETFLQNWARDWQNDIMKCALSQTIFACVTTHGGYNLKKGFHFYDSGAWPQPARNRVVRILGDNNVLSIHGDQHMGILVKQGVEKFADAGYAFMVPGIANGFPRAWWPNIGKRRFPAKGEKFTGKYRDGGGHPLEVIAVANPDPKSNFLKISRTDPRVVGFRKGSGYGMVVLNKKNKLATFSLYRSESVSTRFEGFPQTVYVGGNPNMASVARDQNQNSLYLNLRAEQFTRVGNQTFPS